MEEALDRKRERCDNSASIGTLLSGGPQFALSWFLTDLLGMLLVTPLILMASDAVRSRNPDIEAVGPMLGVLIAY